MNILSLSGGATRFAGLYGAAKTVLELGFNPDLVLGISSGSLAALPLVLGKHKECEELSTTLTLRSFFDRLPVNNKGSITLNAVTRIATCKNSLGLQNAKRLLASIVDNNDFLHYKINDKYPEIVVSCVNFDTGKRELYNLKELDYLTALDVIEASSRIPIITQQQELNSGGCYDGGVYDHNLAGYYINNIQSKVDELVSIYSRPKEFTVKSDKKWRNNLFKTIARLQELQNVETSKNDEQLELFLSEKLNFKLTQIFLPSILDSIYDVDNDKLRLLWDKGVEVAKNSYK